MRRRPGRLTAGAFPDRLETKGTGDLMRTTIGVSFLVLLLGASACSSKSTDGNPGAAGATASGGTGGGASGGSSGSSGSNTAAQMCLDAPVVCLDSDTASTCNPDTLMDESINCTAGVADLGPGLISTGCVTDAQGAGCTFDFEDEPCGNGAPAFAACARAAGVNVDDLTAYFACVSDAELHGLIPCFADFVDEAAGLVDCSDAEAACAPEQTGGTGGTGGGNAGSGGSGAGTAGAGGSGGSDNLGGAGD
jgi:hypothetical protein